MSLPSHVIKALSHLDVLALTAHERTIICKKSYTLLIRRTGSSPAPPPASLSTCWSQEEVLSMHKTFSKSGTCWKTLYIRWSSVHKMFIRSLFHVCELWHVPRTGHRCWLEPLWKCYERVKLGGWKHVSRSFIRHSWHVCELLHVPRTAHRCWPGIANMLVACYLPAPHMFIKRCTQVKWP